MGFNIGDKVQENATGFVGEVVEVDVPSILGDGHVYTRIQRDDTGAQYDRLDTDLTLVPST